MEKNAGIRDVLGMHCDREKSFLLLVSFLYFYKIRILFKLKMDKFHLRIHSLLPIVHFKSIKYMHSFLVCHGKSFQSDCVCMLFATRERKKKHRNWHKENPGKYHHHLLQHFFLLFLFLLHVHSFQSIVTPNTKKKHSTVEIQG